MSKGVVGFFKDENGILKASRVFRDAGFKKFDTFTPFAVHGIEDAMGVKRSIVPWATLIGGFTGLLIGTGVQFWTSAVSWDLNIGGKPHASWPAFIPVTFELTVLFAALFSYIAFLWLSDLPKWNPPLLDVKVTDDTFALFVPSNDIGYDETKIKKMLNDLSANNVKNVAEF